MVCPTCTAIRSLLIGAGLNPAVATPISKAVGVPAQAYAVKKVKRKASAYSKRYGAAFKRLKKKHPRMAFKSLAKKAHKAARRK